MRVALDSNVLLYAAGLNDGRHQQRAKQVLQLLQPHEIIIPIQVIGEFFTVSRRKANRPIAQIRHDIAGWATGAALVTTTLDTVWDAIELHENHHLATWDAVIFAAAAHASCQILLTEDMQHGFTWRGLSLINPFTETGLKALQARLGP